MIAVRVPEEIETRLDALAKMTRNNTEGVLMKNVVLRPVIAVNEENCVNCHRCIAVCPVKMCNDGSGDVVHVNSELCIGCGECIEACTHDARVGLDDTAAFFADLEAGTKMVAIAAPATKEYHLRNNLPNSPLVHLLNLHLRLLLMCIRLLTSICSVGH